MSTSGSRFFNASGPTPETNSEGQDILSLLKSGAEKQKQEEEHEQIKEVSGNIAQSLSKAEQSREKEKEQDDESGQYVTPDHIKNKVLQIEDWQFEYTSHNVIRYLPSQLLSLKDSPHVLTSEHLDLPSKDYYRLKNRLPQQNKREYNNGGNNYNHGGRNYDNTGSMGNFNLGRSGRPVNDKRGGRRNNNRYNRKQDDMEWLTEIEKDTPAPGTAEDFEKYKARIMNEEKKKRGEPMDQAAELQQAGKGNSIDSFFGLAAQPAVSSQNVGVDAKNSRFFSMFSQREPTDTKEITPASQPANKDVSQMFPFLDRGAATAGNDSPQQQAAMPQQRSQFFSQSQSNSPALTPSSQLPPGLEQQQGGKDSFFMSLMSKNPEVRQNSTPLTQSPQKHQSTPGTPQGSGLDISKMNVPSQQQLQQLHTSQQQPTSQHVPLPQQQAVQQPGKEGKTADSVLPPGLQNGPGPLPGSGFDAPPGLQQGQMPQQFNGQRLPPQGQMHLPPGMPPQQHPPWLNPQQLPPNMRQFPPQGGRFMPPPPNGFAPQNFPPHMRPQGIPPQMMYAQGPQGQGMPMFMPPDADGRAGPLPGFFGPPPGYPMLQQQQQGQAHGQGQGHKGSN